MLLHDKTKTVARLKGYLSQVSRGWHPRAKMRWSGGGPGTAVEGQPIISSGLITLRQAWTRYRDVHLVRKGRSERTIKGYRDHVERIFAEWLDVPLREIGRDPARVVNRHDNITNENGPYMANASMRTLRAIYYHARKMHKSLPVDNPVDAIDWNGEKRRDTGMGTCDLKGWFAELAALDNPIRREFHLFMLLSGCRPAALRAIEPRHVNFRERTVHVPNPKGGAERAFDIPLSREMILCLVRVIRLGRQIYPTGAAAWIFPADSASGHLAEHREDRAALSKWGNDLRHSFRTIATAARVSEFDAKLLMNHAVPGVNAGYVTRNKILRDHLRSQQQAISDAVFAALGNDRVENSNIRNWIAGGAVRRMILNAAKGLDDEGRLTPNVEQRRGDNNDRVK
jgi:integrase